MDMRQKAKDLMNLALDEAKGNEKERIAAAFKALKIIAENDFLSSPLDGIDLGGLTGLDKDTVDAASTLLKKVAGGLINRNKKRRD
jgi:hypothetical protein